MPNPELLPCPFCGFTSLDAHRGDTEIATYQISCINMGCECSTALWSKPEEAIEAWNRRAPGWLAIETAPKDGIRILAYNANNKTFYIVRWNAAYEEWSVPGSGIGGLTHWQPLPAGPEE
ncbi:Lar family restriction alleviation protein [Desulfovibrio sp. OttesenSCG-928-G11]|nr:Lar family restriction alleviation protein [Desulfovibrio sp. OttesenSCG-928-G11]